MEKETMIKALKSIKEQMEADRKFSENMGKAFPDAFEANLLPNNKPLLEAILTLLSNGDPMGREDISWFIYEADFGEKCDTIWLGKREIKVGSIEAYVDYFLGE